MPDDTTLGILIDVKQRGEAAFAEASLLAANLREAIDSLNRRTAEGVPVMEAARRAVGELSRGLLESGLSAKEQSEQLKDLRQSLVRYIEAVTAGMAPESAFNAVLAFQTAQMGANASATQAATAANAGGIPVWLGVAAAIAATLAVLSPFIALVGGAAVVLTAFTVAGAGMLALLGGMALGFGAIGAAIVLLGGGASGATGAADALTKAADKLTTGQEALQEFDAAHKGSLTILAQQQREQLVENVGNAQTKYNNALAASQTPVATLVAQLGAVRDAWAQQAAPMALVITQWVAQAIPAVQQLGSSLMSWFGDRLPGVLSAISGIIQALTPSFTALGKFLGDTFDRLGSTGFGVGGTMSLLASTFVDFVKFIVQAAQGLISNLNALSQWFLERLPTYGPIVSQVFGFLGSAVQAVAQLWGRFADWLVANWPAIMANVQASVKSITDEWNKWAPVFLPLIQQLLPALGAALQTISNNAGILVPALLLVAGALMVLVTGLSTIVSWISAFLGWWTMLNNQVIAFGVAGQTGPLNWLINDLVTATQKAEDLVGWLARIPGSGASAPGPNIPGAGGQVGSTQRGFRGRGSGNLAWSP